MVGDRLTTHWQGIMRDNREITVLLQLAGWIFMIFLTACGSGHDSPSETGSLAFSVEWKGAPTIQLPSRTIQALDCAAAGVSTVEGAVYDENDIFLAGDLNACVAHSGRITGVRAGANRTLIILGKDTSGDVLYRGEVVGINVTAGQSNSVGTVVAELFNPSLSAPADGSTVTNGAFSLECSSVTHASEYQIQVSTVSNFTSLEIDETVTSTPYAPTTLSAGTHYWRVRAIDAHGNQSEWSEVWSFTVSSEPGTPPSAPTNVAATAGNGYVTIKWDLVSGATSYNIYWATSAGVSKSTGTKISDVTSPYVHTGLSNGTTYYYVVTAENIYGESGESDEVSATPSAMTRPVPDTGQTQSYTDTFGEDSDYFINPPFYTKLDAQGNDLEDNAIDWVMVRDNVTGLIWEVKTNDGSIHDQDDKYPWQGAQDVFVAELNNQGFGGYSDWRMPTFMELSLIVNSGTCYPAANTDYFPSTMSSSYWSSTTDASNTDNAWRVNFDNGYVLSYSKSLGYYVRAVRGGSGALGAFMDNGDGTVTDTSTGLMWQQETAGQMTWEAALTYCEDLSLAAYDDWRLPNRNEQQSLVNYNTHDPAIDTTAFPNTWYSYYWSSTTYVDNSPEAWTVGFKSGDVGSSVKSVDGQYSVRCVRGGNNSPTATITSPSDSSKYTQGDTISFSGTGEDAEDGTLTGSLLVWTSNIDGQIGTGTSFSRDDLSVGSHTISLTATDSSGATGSDSIAITVEELINVALQENGGIATADSVATYLNTCYPSYAIDGITSSTGTEEGPIGWRGTDIPGWLEVEFNQSYEIEQVSIWFGSHQQTYSISLSLDKISWTEIVPSRLSENTEGSESETAETFYIDPTLAKYIRVDITTTSAPSSHIFKSSINELEAYTTSAP